MGLRIKTFTEILNDMLNWLKNNNSRLTNFFVGSTIRTLCEAVAMELEGMYFQMNKGFKYAIQNAIFNSFDFTQQGAIASVNTMTILFTTTLPQALPIPKGYRFCTAPINGQVLFYQVTADNIVGAGSVSTTVEVECTTPGIVGNVPAYSVQYTTSPLPYVSKVYNETSFTTGKVAESEDDRKKRFTQFINTLARGTNSALLYGCLRVSGVAGAYVDEQIGFVKVYVHDALGNLPTDLQQSVMSSLEDYRAAGVEVKVFPVTKKPVNINIYIQLQSGFDPAQYTILIQDSVTSFLNYFVVSKPLIVAELIKYIMNIDDNAIVDASVNLDSNVVVNSNELIRADNITVIVG